MGTHCNVKFKKDGKIILKEKTIVNGYRLGEDKTKGYANGICCLAAQYVADFKKDIGGVYIDDSPNEKCGYNYTVDFNKGKLTITFDDLDEEVIFTPEQYIQEFQE